MHMGKPLHFSFFLSLPFSNLKIEYNRLLGFLGGNIGRLAVLAFWLTLYILPNSVSIRITENQLQDCIRMLKLAFLFFLFVFCFWHEMKVLGLARLEN